MVDKKRVLIVERHQRMRTLVAEHLQQAGCAVWAATDGVEAARLMRRALPDLVLVDAGVPMGGIDTVRVLRLHPKHQKVPITVTTSGERGVVESLVRRGAEYDIGILRKPYSAQQVFASIDAAQRRQLDVIPISKVRQELASLSRLPALNPLHQKLVRLLSQRDGEVDVPEVVKTIEADQGLAAAMLRVCSTVHYGYRGKTVGGAVGFLGLDRVRNIALSTLVLNALSTDKDRAEYDGFCLVELWRHSVACGLIMEMGRKYVTGSDHFLAGMLHDVGKAILRLRFPGHFREIMCMVREEGRTMWSAERELLGITHADIGYELARYWKLPDAVSMAIAFHHNPEAANQHRRLASLVHMADVKVREFDIGHAGDRQPIAAMPFACRVVFNYKEFDQYREEVERSVEAMLVCEKEEAVSMEAV